jgi:hypothetical protein
MQKFPRRNDTDFVLFLCAEKGIIKWSAVDNCALFESRQMAMACVIMVPRRLAAAPCNCEPVKRAGLSRVVESFGASRSANARLVIHAIFGNWVRYCFPSQ